MSIQTVTHETPRVLVKGAYLLVKDEEPTAFFDFSELENWLVEDCQRRDTSLIREDFIGAFFIKDGELSYLDQDDLESYISDCVEEAKREAADWKQEKELMRGWQI